MKVGDTYECVALLDPKLYPGSKPVPFTIIQIHINGDVSVEDANGNKLQLSQSFIKHFCKQIASA